MRQESRRPSWRSTHPTLHRRAVERGAVIRERAIRVVCMVSIVIVAAACSSGGARPAARANTSGSGSGNAPVASKPARGAVASTQGVACPALWQSALLLLPCSDVPAAMVPDMGADLGTSTDPGAYATSVGCPVPQPQDYAFELETFVTISASDPLGEKVMSTISGSSLPAPGTGSEEMLQSNALWCGSAHAASGAVGRAGDADLNNGLGLAAAAGPTIGSATRWMETAQPQNGWDTVMVVWSQGATLASITLVGTPGTVDVSTVAPLAIAQDRHVMAASGPPFIGKIPASTAATSCPPVWQAEPLVPCADLPAGLVPDPGLAVSTSPSFGSGAIFATLSSCSATSYAAYDALNTPAASGSSPSGGFGTSEPEVLDAAGNCGSSAASIVQSATSSAAGSGTTGSAGIGQQSMQVCQNPHLCEVIWIEGSWVGWLIDIGPSATLSSAEGMAQAQDARLRSA